MAMPENKNPHIVPMILAAVLVVLLVFGAEAAMLLSGELESRRQARRAAEDFVAVMEEALQSEQARHAAMAQSCAQGMEEAMAKKEITRRELSLLTLVNPWNPMAEGYVPQLQAVNDSHAVDARCADALRQMMADCEASGALPYICSSYRSQEKQEELYSNKIERLIGEGYPPAEAPAVAARSVAVPGTSEHQLGLAVDIIDESYPYLNYLQEYTRSQRWLMENSWRYGFILRYPNGSTDITGIIYEPWHYRYVGTERAAQIQRLGLTFEEYLAYRRGR